MLLSVYFSLLVKDKIVIASESSNEAISNRRLFHPDKSGFAITSLLKDLYLSDEAQITPIFN